MMQDYVIRKRSRDETDTAYTTKPIEKFDGQCRNVLEFWLTVSANYAKSTKAGKKRYELISGERDAKYFDENMSYNQTAFRKYTLQMLIEENGVVGTGKTVSTNGVVNRAQALYKSFSVSLTRR